MSNCASWRCLAARLARRAADLGKDDSVALGTAGFALAWVVGAVEEGARLVERALALHPHFAWGWGFSGWINVWLGKPELATEHLARAVRLSPHDPLSLTYQSAAACANFFNGRYAEAWSWAEAAIRDRPDYAFPNCIGAASGALAGEAAEAAKALARLRVRDANPTTYAGLYAAEQQRAAYPDVGPLGTNATVQAAYDAALAVVNKRRWRIVDARAPQAGRREGRIEAVARTPIMGFRDDVVIRVRAEPDGARIDARSSSRYGSFDFGTNAARVRGLMNDIEDAIRSQKPERPPPTQQPAKKSTGKKDQPKR